MLLKAGVLHLDWQRYPSDAIAFYRPFHFASIDEWGIYFDVVKLLQYVRRIFAGISSDVKSFEFDSLLAACFCEVFQHEYFHHISECAATSIEILLHQTGVAWPIYMDYFEHRFRSDHLHSPLEEALANAYAFNSLAFLSRVKKGLRTTRVALYQQSLKRLWAQEPPGYCDAAHYVGGKYIDGAGRLLQLFLSAGSTPSFALDLVAKEVLLSGNATFFAKPEIPVYICGTVPAIAEFSMLVPAPVEAYSALTWLDDSSAVDAYFDKRRKEERRKGGRETVES
jgi:hypothetical protein